MPEEEQKGMYIYPGDVGYEYHTWERSSSIAFDEQELKLLMKILDNEHGINYIRFQ